MSTFWRTPDGKGVEGEVEMPVDRAGYLAARLWVCPAEDCAVKEWVFDLDLEANPENPFCPKHSTRILPAPMSADDLNPIASARARVAARLLEIAAARRDRAVEALTARATMTQKAATEAAKRTAADMADHWPSIAASGVVLVGSTAVAANNPWLAASLGLAMSTVGTVVAYVVAYVLLKQRAERNQTEGEFVGRRAKKVRAGARHIASGSLAAGVWLLAAAPIGVDPTTVRGGFMLLLGCVLAWAVNRTHWDTLWETRRRLKELARLKAEEAARRDLEETRRVATQPITSPTAVVVEDESDPLVVGQRMAARWAKIAQSDTLPPGFLMRRTRIIPEETRELTVPDGDAIVRIGWEYAVESEPGVLVARLGSTPPLLGARDWLASMLGVHPSLVSLVDRPDDQVNRGLLSITDRLALGNTVTWKGPSSLRREGGAILGHVGADMNGNEIYEFIHVPGQLTGGLTVGHSGGGKSAGARVSLLNDLAAGIFPTLHDPVKSLGDFGEFVGIFPMGCTPEHRDVILQALHAERHRRNKAINGRKMRDRLGRVRPEPGVFQVGRDGPQLRSYWEEFHRNAPDKGFLAPFLDLMRVQRAVAMDSELYTQGGGLQDLGDSVVRGLLNQVRMRLYRMPDNLARLAGYSGDYMPSQLPRVAGACLLIAEGVPVIPLRGAWVTRDDEEGCVYDYLYDPAGQPLLAAAQLPAETLKVFECEGLMDLWRLGQGPNGMSNLLADSAPIGLAPPAVQAAGTGVGASPTKMDSADVLLSIVFSTGGCHGRAPIDNHDAWRTAPGWGGAPKPSTISRAVTRLEKQGLLTRTGGVYQVTSKGEGRAKQAVAALGGLSTSADAPTAAELERQAEARDEQLEIDGVAVGRSDK
jgi:hypothetical protein